MIARHWKRGDSGPEGTLFWDYFRGRPRFLSPATFAEYRKNQQKINARYREKNRTKILASMRERYRNLTPEQKAQRAARMREYRKNNPDKIRRHEAKRNAAARRKAAADWRRNNRQYYKARRRSDVQFRLTDVLRCRLRDALKGRRKTASVLALLGCTPQKLKKHLEKQFLPGMTWENHGPMRRGRPPTWNIDHIVPCAAFDLRDPEQQRKCFHFSNLRPLWARDNILKSDKIL